MVSRGLLTFSGRGGSCWCLESPGMQFLWPQALLLPWLAGAECIHLPGGLKARYLCSIRWWICPSSSMGKQKYFEHYSLVLTVNNFLWFPPRGRFWSEERNGGKCWEFAGRLEYKPAFVVFMPKVRTVLRYFNICLKSTGWIWVADSVILKPSPVYVEREVWHFSRGSHLVFGIE